MILDVRAQRLLLADWFVYFAKTAGLDLTHRGESAGQLTLGGGAGDQVVARFIEKPPFVEFRPVPPTDGVVVLEAARQAEERVAAADFGAEVWYSFDLREPKFNYFSPHGMFTALVLRLGTQTRIGGWRRLGPSILLEFKEGASEEATPDKPLLAPPALVSVHLAISAPGEGFFAAFVAHSVVETVAAICTFALGRPVDPPFVVSPTPPDKREPAIARVRDPAVLTLARKSVSLDIFSLLGVDGGRGIFERLRAALITFDAGIRQERDSVAAILYVVTAESLTVPAAKWRNNRLTARFVDFYLSDLAADLDTIVGHSNFEAAFRLKRGAKSAQSLRKKLLTAIYNIRSGQVHEGLYPTYKGGFASVDLGADMQRALIHDFAEAAILGYLRAPRSSVIGHPLLDSAVGGADAGPESDLTD